MCWKRTALAAALVAMVVACRREDDHRGSERGNDVRPKSLQPIDWEQSVGIFIGIEEFHPGPDAPADVRYAADDSTDLAHFFARERTDLLPAGRTHLLLAGRPHKRESLERLRDLQRTSNVTIAEGGVCIDANAIYGLLDARSRDVGANGILILSLATHGLTVDGAQLLLTCDSPRSTPRGVVLGRMLQALRGGPGRRLLLLVDACRTPGSGMLPPFEDIDMPAGYAVLHASSAGAPARGSDRLKNGYFTHALLEGLRSAPAGADGFLSLRELDAYVGTRVRELSRTVQQPEGRFSGGLGSIELLQRDEKTSIAKILAPQQGAEVTTPGTIELEIVQPDLYATVLVCAHKNHGACTNQSPGTIPLSARPGEMQIDVTYGAPDRFQLHVALSPDSDFLRGQEEVGPDVFERRAERVVHWLGPVEVNFN